MICKFRFRYGSIVADVDKVKTLVIGEEKYRQLREVLRYLPEDPLGNDNQIAWQVYIADIDMIIPIVPTIEIEEIVVTSSGNMTTMLAAVCAISSKMEESLKRLETYHPQQFNEKCNVHVPGKWMLELKEVTFVGNACTDTVNGMMQEGWRMVAVCPQPDQRRPDYILGR